MKAVSSILHSTLFLALATPLAIAQSAPSAAKSATSVHTFYLKNVPQANDLNEILTTVRNMLPQNIKIYAVQSQGVIVVEAADDEIRLAERIVAELDRPRKSYRLTYTVNELDGAKRLSSQHLAMNLVAGQPVTLKQGSRIPVITSSSDPANPTTQYAYVDIGLLVSATINSVEGGASLKTKVEQSSVASERSSAAIPDPNIRQTTLESISTITNGKPTVVGSLDVPGSTHHLEIEALLEPMP